MAAKPPSKAFFGYDKKEAVKIATSNLFIDTTIPSAEFMTNIIFEDIGGNELIDTQNHNFLFNTDKSNILNIATVIETTSPKSLFKSSNIYNSIFDSYEINLVDKIPAVGNGSNGINTYFSLSQKSIIIEFINISDDEEVEVQFISTVFPISDTI